MNELLSAVRVKKTHSCKKTLAFAHLVIGAKKLSNSCSSIFVSDNRNKIEFEQLFGSNHYRRQRRKFQERKAERTLACMNLPTNRSTPFVLDGQNEVAKKEQKL